MIGQQIVNGLMLGSVYGLAAMGMTLIFAVMKFLNLGHGAIVVVTAYIGFVIAVYTGNVALCILGAVVGGGLVGLLLQRGAFERVRRQPHLVSAVLAIGLSLMIEEALRMGFFAGRPITYPNTVQMTGFVELGVMRFSHGHLLGLGITIVVMVALYYIFYHTQMGRALRATAENAEVARLLGINDGMMAMLTFSIAGVLAGFSGVLYGVVYAGVSPYIAIVFTFKALAVTLLAGAGNIWGAVAAGIILGLIEVSTMVFGLGAWRDMFAFGLIILILIFRPRGLFGSPYEV